MAYTLAQAAIATGRDRSTLLKAIKSGKISAARDELIAWQVDAAERYAHLHDASVIAAVANLGHAIGVPGLRLRRLP